jgi:hypothetical protein
LWTDRAVVSEPDVKCPAKLHVLRSELRPQRLHVRLRPDEPVDQVDVGALRPVVPVRLEVPLIGIDKVPIRARRVETVTDEVAPGLESLTNLPRQLECGTLERTGPAVGEGFTGVSGARSVPKAIVEVVRL